MSFVFGPSRPGLKIESWYLGYTQRPAGQWRRALRNRRWSSCHVGLAE